MKLDVTEVRFFVLFEKFTELQSVVKGEDVSEVTRMTTRQLPGDAV